MASATQKQPIMAAALKEGHAPQKNEKKYKKVAKEVIDFALFLPIYGGVYVMRLERGNIQLKMKK